MAGYDRDDYFAEYGSFLVDKDSNATYSGYWQKGLPRRVSIRLHYHPLVIKPQVNIRLEKLLSNVQVSADDCVMVVGCAYGWLCEALETRTGCKSYGVDPSQYIQDSIHLSPDDELREAIEANPGLSCESGLGKTLFEKFRQYDEPRSRARVIQEDLLSYESLQRAIAIGGKPTLIVTEECWQVLKASRPTVKAVLQLLDVPLLHFIDGDIC